MAVLSLLSINGGVGLVMRVEKGANGNKEETRPGETKQMLQLNRRPDGFFDSLTHRLKKGTILLLAP